MRFVLLFSLFSYLICTQADAQIKVRTFYDKEKTQLKELFYIADSTTQALDGPYVSYYYNGNIKTSGHYENNQASGFWKYYYENGNIKMEGALENDETTGKWRYYYENGRVSMEGKIEGGKKRGNWTFYYENGAVKSQGAYKNDIKEGIWNNFYEDSALKSQIFYENGDGLYKEFYPSGELKMAGMNRNGASDSLWIYYYESGDKKARGYFEQGVREGRWTYFYPNGNKSAEGDYEAGKKSGKWTYFYENGAVSSEGVERAGYKEGYWKLYHKDGSFKGESILDRGNGEYKEYHENGKLKVKGFIANGKNSGKWTYYYEDGSLEGEAYFADGVGDFTGYYRNGTVKMKGKIEDGKNVGVWELYEKNGNLAGYYRPFYEDEKPVYKIIDYQSRSDTTADYLKPEYKYKNRRLKYFTPRINEFKGFIISANPIAPTLGSLPISLEYYLQERLGHELQYTIIRDPFLSSDQRIPINTAYKRGFSLALKQKFYHPDVNIGMLYFGHEVRFSSLGHRANVNTAGDEEPAAIETIGAEDTRMEYSILFGNRWINFFGEKWINEEDKIGVTLDIYGGIGIGYRSYKANYAESQYGAVFEDVNKKKLAIPLRFGVNLGIIF